MNKEPNQTLHFLYKKSANPHWICFLLLWFVFSSSVYCQSANVHLYTVRDGLPASGLYTVYEDHIGYLWISSAGGISRFDGQKFVNYGLADGLPALDGAFVLDDKDHRLWFGTRSGMAQLIGNKFITYPKNDSMVIEYTYGMMQCRSGEVWALTDMGVYQFDDSIWSKVHLFPGERFTRNIIETDSGLFVNYGHMIAFQNKLKNWIVIDRSPDGKLFFNVMLEKDGRILVSTKTGILELKGNRFVPFVKDLKGTGYFNFLFDSFDRLWYCYAVNDSAFHLSRTSEYSEFQHILPQQYGIISGIMEDSHGNIWAATQEGLLKINLSPFDRLTENNQTVKGIKNALPHANSGVLIIGENGVSQVKFEKTDQNLQVKKVHKKGMEIVDCFSSDDKGNFWILSREREVFCYDGKQMKDFTHLIKYSSDKGYYSITYDKANDRFLLGGDSSLYVGNSKGIRRFVTSNTGKPIYGFPTVFSTRDNRVLIHIPGSGIYLLKGKENLELIFPLAEKRNFNFKVSFYEDWKQNIWMNDEKAGLLWFRFNSEGSFQLIDTISKKDGLLHEKINSITADGLNRIWVVNPGGIDILQFKSNKWEVFNYSKDINLKVNSLAAKLITDTDGNVWLNDWEQLVRFNTGEIFLNKEIPKAVIEKIQLNSRDVDWGKYTDSLFGYRKFPVNPVFNYNKNTVSIYFGGISFYSSPQIEYSYQLNPIDTNWSQPRSNASVSFVNLSPGHYTFQVRTRDQASNWSQPAVFSFTILTPFWMQWWFIALCVLVSAGIIYSVYLYRVNELKKLLAIRTRISQDLHDEVGSALTSINILSKVTGRNLEKDKAKAADMIRKITEQSESMQQSMRDIVWSIHPDNDKIQNLVIRMREYLGQTAEPKNILVDFAAEEKLLKQNLSMLQRQNIFLIFKEAVNNSVKYSQAGKITVRLESENSHLFLSIKDDGVGFVRTSMTSSNGLKNMEQRAKALKGKLQILSGTGQGVSLLLTCPATL